MSELTRVFVPFGDVIKTTTRTDDGIERPARIVKGLMTDESLDLDGQIVDFEWAKRASGDWFQKWGNVREQHTARAVGKGKEIEILDTSRAIGLASKVVDTDAVVKIDEGVLSGYSVGIKGARVVKDAKAPNGRIVGGQIVEVSIVDHPANESCKFVVAKAAKAAGEKKDVLEKSDAVDFLSVEDDEILTKVAEPEAAKAPVELEGEEAVHNDALGRARQALRDLITQEAAEDDAEWDDIAWLASIASSLECWASDEAFEQELDEMGLEPAFEILVDLAAVPDRAKRAELMRGANREQIDAAFKAVAEKVAAKSAEPEETPVEPEVEADKAVEPEPAPAADQTDAEKAASREDALAEPEPETGAEKAATADTEKFLTPDTLKAVLPDALKAILPEILKEHTEVFEEALTGKFASKDLETTVEQLGKRAQPGGPAIRPEQAGLRAVEKSHPVNEVLDAGEVPASVLQEIQKYVDLSKSEDIGLRQSAQRMVAKLKNQYGLAEAS